jgi:hypothetical protein
MQGSPVAPPFDLDAIKSAWESRAGTDGGRTLDDRTWTDLTLDEVFTEIDRTESTLGQASLYHRLRRAPAADHLPAFEALVAALPPEGPAHTRARRVLGRLQDAHGYDIWWVARPGAITIQGWYAICPVLTVSTLVLIALTVAAPAAWPALLMVLGLNVLLQTLTARDAVQLRQSIRQLAPIIATGEGLTFLTDTASSALTSSLEADVALLRRLKTIARWASEDPLMLSGRTNLALDAVSQLFSSVYEYVSMLLLLDGNAIYFAHRDLVARHGALLRVAATIGEIDAAVSVASWRSERSDWSRPAFGEPGSAATLSGVRHPLVADAVPNDVTLTPGRGLVITGSNMSGKSTFLRTVGVNIVLAQTIHTCLAGTYRAPVIDVQSCIGRSDDLLAGKSYYLVEVEQVVSRLGASNAVAPHLFIFDELFRGTNAIERIAAGESVLRALLNADGIPKPHFVLAATHDAELVGMLADRYEAFHFTDTISDDGLAFEYRLQPGAATTRNAIALLALHGAPAAVVTRALASAATIERQRRFASTGEEV